MINSLLNIDNINLDLLNLTRVRKIILIILVCLLKVSSLLAQITFTTNNTPSTCSSNGTITVIPNGGSTPYVYQIISSSVGIIRPAQSQATFNNLPSGTYSIRVSDGAGNSITNGNVVVAGNYIPLSFTHTQQQSTLTIIPINGRSPYKFSYSTNGGTTYTTPIDSGIFHCMPFGTYLFRVYDSCNNFYTESVVVNPVNIIANFSCINNNTSIVLNSISGGNGGYVYQATGIGYNQTNTTGSFTGINRCNRNITIEVKDRCNLRKTFNGCVLADYTFNVACVNFKNKTVTLNNITGTNNNIPYQYIANNALYNTPTIINIPNVTDSIVVGMVDSCGFKNTTSIKKMKTSIADSLLCESGSVSLKSYYQIDNRAISFPPTRYTSISGPTSFDITDADLTDTSFAFINDLQTGSYTYKVTNACGDEIIGSFNYTRKCYKDIIIQKTQSCNSLSVLVYKDCKIDSNVLYKILSTNNVLISQNNTGIFNGILNNDSCYKLEVKDIDCDTTLLDNITPYRPKLKIFQNACNEVSIGTTAVVKRSCGASLPAGFANPLSYILMDSLYNVLQTTTSSVINPIPPKTYWISGTSPACNADTVKYIKQVTLNDTIKFCISPSIRFTGNGCKTTWQVKMLNNTKNINYQLTLPNGVSLVSNSIFIGVDSGRYILKDGCNEQELFLPNYYNFKTTINPGCPSNASVTASYDIDYNYIADLGNRYFFTVCNEPIIDYNIKEIGSSDPLIYSVDGNFTNLKTGTFYAIFFKGNETCNYFSDTIFTPFYVRPAITATYGLICNGNNATVKASVVGGTKPYTYEVLNSSIPNIITDSNSVLYTNLPLGVAQFRVSDACGISTSYSTEVLSVNFQPSFKKKCDGTVQLIAPDIFNTEYVWTNKNNDTIGTTPTVYTTPNGDDTFKVTIKHLTCTLDKSLVVSNFSSSLANADAGANLSVDTSFAILQANTPPSTAIGTWKQIDPSSGNSVFVDIHDPKTKVTVNTFPGQYTYVWTIQDTSIGCYSEDTVVVSYLRCPNILPVLYTKTVTNATCGGSAQIDIKVTQTSTPIHYFWNTGDTTATIKNLTDSFYVVIIRDETSCTDDIYDTTFLPKKINTVGNISIVACDGDTLTLNNKKYFTAGNFVDTLVNSVGCDSILNIKITLQPKSLTFDTLTLCEGNSFTLPNGQTITQTGSYIAKFINSVGCDSLKNYSITFNPTKSINIDTAICKGFTYQLPNGNNINQSGKYIDSFKTTLGCDSIITTNLIVKDTLPPVFIGDDTTICENEKLLIELNYPNYANYIWQDSSNLSSYTIVKEGIYYVKVYDGCTSTEDSVDIKTKNCTCYFYVPTAFSPNNDGVNEVFLPFNRCEYFTGYSLTVFNRWSELVFKTNDVNIGWNGFYKDEAQPVDSYVFYLEYFDVLKNEKTLKKGTVNLIR